MNDPILRFSLIFGLVFRLHLFQSEEGARGWGGAEYRGGDHTGPEQNHPIVTMRLSQGIGYGFCLAF